MVPPLSAEVRTTGTPVTFPAEMSVYTTTPGGLSVYTAISSEVPPGSTARAASWEPK